MTIQSNSELISGRYRLTALIASGGMGEVWRATDGLLGRSVAIKLGRSELSHDDAFLQRFRFEAKSAASLSHPNIATVFDYGEYQDATGLVSAFIVMEFIEGLPLSRIIPAQGLAVPQVLDILAQSAAGLEAAHAKGLVHRDIKPGNLMIKSDGALKITDFGIAKAMEGADLTLPGSILGTARYMAPEQLSNKGYGPPGDIFSLGIVAYQCVSGSTPFGDRDPAAGAFAILNEEIPPLRRTIAPEVASLIASMLQKNPEERPTSTEVANRARFLSTQIRPSADSDVHSDDTAVFYPAMSLGEVDPLGFQIPVNEQFTDMVTDATQVETVPVLDPAAIVSAPATRFSPVAWLRKHPGQWNRKSRLALLALVLLIGVIALSWARGPVQVKVPSLVGESFTKAQASLAAVHLKISKSVTNIADAPAGEVMSQNLPPGTVVSAGSKVAVIVSSGLVNINAATLIGQPYPAVETALQSLGLRYSVLTVASSKAPGTVLSLNPSTVAPYGSTVTINYAVAPVVQPAPVAQPAQPGPSGKGHGKGS